MLGYKQSTLHTGCMTPLTRLTQHVCCSFSHLLATAFLQKASDFTNGFVKSVNFLMCFMSENKTLKSLKGCVNNRPYFRHLTKNTTHGPKSTNNSFLGCRTTYQLRWLKWLNCAALFDFPNVIRQHWINVITDLQMSFSSCKQNVFLGHTALWDIPGSCTATVWPLCQRWL